MPLKRTSVDIQDEGTDQGPANSINFVGTPVTAVVADGVATITVTGGGSGSPGGADKTVQFSSSGSFGGIATMTSDGNWPQILSSSAGVPTAPSGNGVILFDHDLAGRQMLSQRGPTGLHTAFQAILARNNIGIWDSPGNSAAAPTTWGVTAPTTSGTLTSRVVSTVNTATMARRVAVVSAATAGSFCGFRSIAPQYSIYNGFFMTFRFIVSDAAAVTNGCLFVGLTANIAPNTGPTGSSNPSSFTNSFGVFANPGQTNLAIMTAASGSATTASLGSSFPANTLTTDFYDFTIFAPPSGTSIGWRVERINTGDVYAGTITSGLPSNKALLVPQFWRSNGGTALAVGLDLVSLYIETDN